MATGPVNLYRSMEKGLMLQISSGAAPYRRSKYAAAKDDSERILLGSVQIIRPYATVGPGMGLDRSFAISTFIRQALAGEPLSVTPGITRSFCHITDMIVQMLHVLVAGDYLPYDAGSDDAITMEEAARAISPSVFTTDQELQSNSNCDYYVPNLGRMAGLFGSYSLLTNYSSVSAIKDTYEYYKEVK